MPIKEIIFKKIIKKVEQNTINTLTLSSDMHTDKGSFLDAYFFKCCKFEVQQMIQFANAMQKNSSISELSFSGLIIGPEEALYLGRALMCNEKLDKLIFYSSIYTKNSIITIAKALSENIYNKSYSLCVNYSVYDAIMLIDDEVATVLAKLIIDKKLYELDVALTSPSSRISSSAATILVKAIDINPHMQVIGISDLIKAAGLTQKSDRLSEEYNRPKNKKF